MSSVNKQLIVLIGLLLSLTLVSYSAGQENAGTPAPDTVQQAQELLALSKKQNWGDHALALRTAEQALVAWQQVGDKVGIAQAYTQIARCHFVQSNLSEARQNFEQSLQIWRALHDTKQEASTLIFISFIDARNGEWSAAISRLTQAQSLLTEQDSAQMGQIAVAFSDIFNDSGLSEDALVQLQRAEEYFRRTSEERAKKRMDINIGYTLMMLGRPTEALAHLQQALASFEPDTLDAAQSHEYLGQIYISMGQYNLALEHLPQAIAIYERIGNPLEAARSRALLGQSYQAQGEFLQARNYYNEALMTFDRIADRLNGSAILFALGRMELEQGNYDKAETYLFQSINETEQLRRESTSRDLTAAFSANIHDRYALYIECLMHKHQADPFRGLDVKAFETSDLARARSLAELLRGTQTSPLASLNKELADREKSLRQTLRAKEDYKVSLLSKEYKKEEIDSLELDLKRLETEYAQVADTISQRYPGYRQITRPTGLSLKQIQQQALSDDDTILLEYSLGIKKSFLWAVTRTDLVSYELPGSGTIEEAAKDLYNSLTAQQPDLNGVIDPGRRGKAEDQLPQQISRLSNMVLGPVTGKLRKRVIIVADGALQQIPFQVLTVPANPPDPVAENKPLLINHEVVNEPSASTLALLLNESVNRRHGPNSVAIIADPVFNAADTRVKATTSGSLQAAVAIPSGSEIHQAFRDVSITIDPERIPRLLASREEADAIIAKVPWFTGFTATGFSANRQAVTSANLSNYRVLHFATHALVDNEHPQISGIVLSLVDQEGHRQDGFLRLPEIYNLKLPVDLVVLSACQTGLGKDVKGEGLIGLTRGFMYAGASGVVASLWKVDDEATAELMKHFYEGLFEKGLSPAAALREAQLALRAQKRWQEPYYWAGFIIEGQYNGRLQSDFSATPAARLTVLVVLLILVAGAIAFFVIRRLRTRTQVS